MEAFANVCFLLATVLLCSSFTEGAISSWQLNSESAISSADTPIAVTVAETSVETSVLFTLTATVDTGNLVSYAITTQTGGQFKIGDFGTSNAGKVQLDTSKVLDYETGTPIVIEVTATDDTSGTALTGVATVTITITDVTTYTPVFTTPSSTSFTCVAIPDMSAVSTAVYTVVAANAATNGITYSFGSGNSANDFTITGGAITVATALDKTRTALYGLAVLGIDADTDTATETGTALIVVTVGGTCPSTSGAGTVAASVITIMSGILLSLFKQV